MTPENTVQATGQQGDLTPENKALLDDYSVYLHRALSGHAPRTYLGCVKG
jgi:hypothetical protein